MNLEEDNLHISSCRKFYKHKYCEIIWETLKCDITATDDDNGSENDNTATDDDNGSKKRKMSNSE